MVTVNCIVCGKEFSVRPYRIGTAKTCSMSCAGKIKPKRFRRTERACKQCGTRFQIQIGELKHKGHGTFCSRKCVTRWQEESAIDRPRKNPHSTSRTRERQWSVSIRQRDNNTCQRCKDVAPSHDAHHIAPRSQRPDLKFDLSNGVTLCSSCHRWVHQHPIEAVACGLLSTESYELAAKNRKAA